jgi:hypothetical protein
MFFITTTSSGYEATLAADVTLLALDLYRFVLVVRLAVV